MLRCRAGAWQSPVPPSLGSKHEQDEMRCYTIISTQIVFIFIYDCQELPMVPIKCSDSGEFQETWILFMKHHEKREENFFSALISIWVHVLFYLLFLFYSILCGGG